MFVCVCALKVLPPLARHSSWLSLNYLPDLLPPLVFVVAFVVRTAFLLYAGANVAGTANTFISAYSRSLSDLNGRSGINRLPPNAVSVAAAATLAISILHNLVNECVLIAPS